MAQQQASSMDADGWMMILRGVCMSTQTHVSHRLDMRPQWQDVEDWFRTTTPELSEPCREVERIGVAGSAF